MKKSKRVLSLLVTLIVVLSIGLTGCGKNTDTTQAPVSATAGNTQETATEKALEPYEVTWYTVADGTCPDTGLVEDEIAKILKDTNTTVKINFVPWSEYSDKMAMIISSGEPFDIAFTSNWTQYYQNVAKGAFVDITDMYNEKLPKLSAVMNPALVDGARVKGRIYGLPTNKEAASAYGYDVDKEYAEQLGIDLSAIKTYADMESALKLAKEKLPGVTPLFMKYEYQMPTTDWDVMIDDKVPGAVMMNDGFMKVINQFETKEKQDMYRLLHKWYNEGYINKNPSTVKDENILASGKMFARPSTLGPVPDWTGAANRVITRVYIGDKIVTTSTCVGAMVAFSKTSKDIDRALQFFDEISTNSDAHNALIYGIQDKHYQVIDESTTPKQVDIMPGKTSQDIGYWSGGAWTLGGDFFISYLSKTDPKNRNDMIKQYNQTAVSSPILSFSVDTEPIKTEVAACQNVYAELGNGIGTGELDPEVYLPKFLEKLKAAGSDKIIAELQKQVDQWRKDNGK